MPAGVIAGTIGLRHASAHDEGALVREAGTRVASFEMRAAAGRRVCLLPEQSLEHAPQPRQVAQHERRTAPLDNA